MRENFKPTILRVFGGLVTFIDRIALGLGVSPRAENTRFAPGMVASRDGYSVFATDGGQPISGVTQLIRGNGDRHLITLTTSGRLKAEFPEGTLSYLMDPLVGNARMSAASLFSTQYMCFGDGRLGVGPMCRYNGSEFTMVGAGAPGSAPVIAESATASVAPSTGLAAGVHSCVIVFVNKNGDVSGWSPVHSATFVGGKKTSITVPLGPTNDTAQRIIAITPANDARNFMYTEKTILNENTTATAVTIDLDEDDILSSELSVTRWLTSFVPWAPLGCASFQERLLVWGARATLQPGVAFDPAVSATTLQNIGFRNLAFDGGFNGNIPNGWTPTGTGHSVGGGGSTEPFYGQCFRILGDASTTQMGFLSQTVRNNSNYLRPQARYGVAVLMKSPAGTPGNIVVKLRTGAGVAFHTATFPCGTSGDDCWVSATSEMASVLSTDETSIKIDVYWAHATLGMGVGNTVDIKLAIYDADDQQHLHTINVSDSGRPGAFVGETCAVSVGPDDGEGIRSVFRLRDFLFVAKERSLYGLTSTSSGEPVTWAVGLTDPLAGTPSVDGVAPDDKVAVIASRDGALLFDGASASCISDEIEDVWRGADWSNGHRAVVVHDRAKKVMRFALPMAGDVYGASRLLVLDYKEGMDSAVPSGNGRKWSRDTFLPITSVDALTTVATEVIAGLRVLSGRGVHVPILSIYGSKAVNLVDPVDLDLPTWSFPVVSPTVSTGQPDGRSGNNASWWAFASGSTYVARMTLPVTLAGRYGESPIFSMRLNPNIAMTLTVSVATGNSYTFSLPAGSWTRVVAPMVGVLSTALSLTTLTLTFAASGGAGATIMVASYQIDSNIPCGDWGFTGSAGTDQPASSALIVTPVDAMRRDFAGAISFLYETAPFGEEIGRSTFDSCVVRARGNGYLRALYTGTGTRSWTMSQTQLAASPDEDFEFGADLKAPGATLTLSVTEDGGWVVVNRVGVANKAESIGWQRGRNG